MVTAVSMGINIYKLSTPSRKSKDGTNINLANYHLDLEDDDELKPIQRIFKFKDVVTAV